MSGVLFPGNKAVPLRTRAQLQLWGDGWWLLCLALAPVTGENTNNQGQEQPLQCITRAVVFSGFAFSIPG